MSSFLAQDAPSRRMMTASALTGFTTLWVGQKYWFKPTFAYYTNNQALRVQGGNLRRATLATMSVVATTSIAAFLTRNKKFD